MATAETKKTKKTEEERVDDLLDAIQEPTKKRAQRVAAGPDSPYRPFDKTYTQARISFFGKLELIKVVSAALNKAMAGEDGASIQEIMESVGADRSTITNSDSVVRAITKLAEWSPEIVLDITMISLAVPKHERPIVAEILQETHDEETGTGGLSDEDGLNLLNNFAYQNGAALRDFFTFHLPKIMETFSKTLSPSDPEPVTE